MDNTRLIGIDGHLPWRLPADLAHFRALTMGHVVVMGRRTYESIGRPLTGRENIVLTRGTGLPAGVSTATSLRTALQVARGQVVFVIGGAAVYEEALPLATHLFLTRIGCTVMSVKKRVPSYFPEWSGFRRVNNRKHASDALHPWPMRFQTWERA